MVPFYFLVWRVNSRINQWMPLALKRMDAIERRLLVRWPQERGIHAASTCDNLRRVSSIWTTHLVRALKRHKCRAPMPCLRHRPALTAWM